MEQLTYKSVYWHEASQEGQALLAAIAVFIFSEVTAVC